MSPNTSNKHTHPPPSSSHFLQLKLPTLAPLRLTPAVDSRLRNVHQLYINSTQKKPTAQVVIQQSTRKQEDELRILVRSLKRQCEASCDYTGLWKLTTMLESHKKSVSTQIAICQSTQQQLQTNRDATRAKFDKLKGKLDSKSVFTKKANDVRVVNGFNVRVFREGSLCEILEGFDKSDSNKGNGGVSERSDSVVEKVHPRINVLSALDEVHNDELLIANKKRSRRMKNKLPPSQFLVDANDLDYDDGQSITSSISIGDSSLDESSLNSFTSFTSTTSTILNYTLSRKLSKIKLSSFKERYSSDDVTWCREPVALNRIGKSQSYNNRGVISGVDEDDDYYDDDGSINSINSISSMNSMSSRNTTYSSRLINKRTKALIKNLRTPSTTLNTKSARRLKANGKEGEGCAMVDVFKYNDIENENEEKKKNGNFVNENELDVMDELNAYFKQELHFGRRFKSSGDIDLNTRMKNVWSSCLLLPISIIIDSSFFLSERSDNLAQCEEFVKCWEGIVDLLFVLEVLKVKFEGVVKDIKIREMGRKIVEGLSDGRGGDVDKNSEGDNDKKEAQTKTKTPTMKNTLPKHSHDNHHHHTKTNKDENDLLMTILPNETTRELRKQDLYYSPNDFAPSPSSTENKDTDTADDIDVNPPVLRWLHKLSTVVILKCKKESVKMKGFCVSGGVWKVLEFVDGVVEGIVEECGCVLIVRGGKGKREKNFGKKMRKELKGILSR